MRVCLKYFPPYACLVVVTIRNIPVHRVQTQVQYCIFYNIKFDLQKQKRIAVDTTGRGIETLFTHTRSAGSTALELKNCKFIREMYYKWTIRVHYTGIHYGKCKHRNIVVVEPKEGEMCRQIKHAGATYKVPPTVQG